MGKAFCAAIDWGSSAFRLWLMAGDGTVLGERRSGEGMLKLAREDFPAVMERHLAALDARPDLPVVICGMAGARQGWREAGYLDVPAALAAIAASAASIPDVARDVRILPGIAQRDAARPDVMRGEETQLLGAFGAGSAGALACMPGTHSKWVRLEEGRVEAFATFMTGELYSAVGRHTILVHALEEDGEIAGRAAFAKAVRHALENDAALLNRLFAIRSGQLLGYAERAEGRATLSGLLIGSEIAGARRLLGTGSEVTLIASEPLAALYYKALELAGMAGEMIDADAAVRRGLLLAAQLLWPQGEETTGAR